MYAWTPWTTTLWSSGPTQLARGKWIRTPPSSGSYIQNYYHGHLYFSFHVINEVHSQLLMRLYFFSAWRPKSRPSPASRSRIGFPGVHLDQLRPAWHAAATQSVQQHPRMIRTILHKHHCEVFINISVYIQQTSHSFSKAYVCFIKTYAMIFHPTQAQSID